MPPSQGEVWNVDLEPIKGREQAGARPGLILSHDKLNHGPAELVVIVPLTTRHRPVMDRFRVQISPPDGGLREISYAIPEQIRVLSTSRLLSRYGRLSAKKIAEVEDLVRVVLNL